MDILFERIAEEFGNYTQDNQPTPLDRFLNWAVFHRFFKPYYEVDNTFNKLTTLDVKTDFQFPKVDMLFNYRTYYWILTIADSELNFEEKISIIKDAQVILIKDKGGFQEIKKLIDRLIEKFKSPKIRGFTNNLFIDESKIELLKKISNPGLDLTKLIQICEELNSAYGSASFLSVSYLIRTLIDHVPPIFKQENFEGVVNSYGERTSMKKQLKHLSEGARAIADMNLHTQIQRKEFIPTEAQIHYMPQIDILLSEIIKKLS